MRDDLLTAFQMQARACADLGSPFTARLMTLLPGLLSPGTALMQRMEAWQGDLGPAGASLPLRLAGGLHHLVLTGTDAGLAAVWPPSDADPAKAIAAALARHDAVLADWITHAPQTNEVGRSAVILPAAALLAARTGLPLVLSELGASAGLNLNFPLYALDVAGVSCGGTDPVLRLAPDWTGPAPHSGPVPVAMARGVDLNPLTPARDGFRLLSYIWPDQHARLARLRAALAAAADHPPQVDGADAADWLEVRLTRRFDGRCHLVFHTVAFQYFPAPAQDRIRRAMANAGARATEEAPLAWLAMEADGQPDGAAVTLCLWPGGETIALGRAGFHGQWVKWAPR